jgi:hypothetical protein
MIHDPTHPLYGQQFRVAARPSRPDAQGTHLLVFLRDTVQLRLPLSATLPAPRAPLRTKLTLEAVTTFIETAHACGVWQSDPHTCGESSPTRCNKLS